MYQPDFKNLADKTQTPTEKQPLPGKDKSIEKKPEIKNPEKLKPQDRHKTKKFRNKIFKIFLLVSLIPLIIISISSLLVVIKTRQQNIAELQSLAIDNTREKTIKFLNEQMEGFNLVISGKSRETNYNIPATLTQADPDHLLFLIKKKKSRDIADNLTTISFTDLNGNIVSEINKDSELKIIKYYDNNALIAHNDFTPTEFIGRLDTDSSGFKTALLNSNYILPEKINPEADKIELFSQIQNQEHKTIGVFRAELNIGGYFDKLTKKINEKKEYKINTKDNDLSGLNPDIIINTLAELRKLSSVEILLNNVQADLTSNIILIDANNNLLAKIDKDGQVTLKTPRVEITNLLENINITPGIDHYTGDLDITKPLAGNPYVSEFECAACTDQACSQCKDGEYVTRLAMPIKNADEKIIGVYLLEIEAYYINQYINTVVFGDATKELNEVDPNNLIYLLQGVKQSSGQARKISFINKDGTVLAQIDETGAIALKNNYWEPYASGTAIVYPGINLFHKVDDNAANNPDFATAIYGDNYFGQLEFSEQTPIMRLASQFENEDRERIGVVTAEVDLTPVDKIVKNIKLGNTGYTYLVDGNGRLIAGQDDLGITGSDLTDIPLIKSVLGGKIYDGLTEFTTYTNPKSTEVIFAGAPMAQAGVEDKVDWFILSEWPRDDAFSVIDDILRLSIIITLATLILIIILGIIFTGQIVKPIGALSKGAQEISKGNLDYEIKLKTGDEFELLKDKFNEMVKVLKDNRRLRDEFVFISAHELRTPVTAIKGYLSMILDESFGPVPKEIKSTLGIVNSSNERLVQLVHDLLEIARSEAGKMKITLSKIPIFDAVQTVINELRSLSDQKSIAIDYNEKFQAIKVNADPAKLKEVLVNIIGNAIKYTKDNGGIKVWHEVKGRYLFTHIKDHGIGMSEEEVGQLFSKFYRAQNDDTKEIEGTGLGLFICKEIIERMKGKISVTSKKGEGSIFSFSLEIV